jgi:D-hydroxyproline dehydrogenase subunit alpha
MNVDVAVVGAGPAGLAAAARAAESGADVVLLDDGARPGGQIWRHRSRAALSRAGRRWLRRLDRSGARRVSGAAVAEVVSERARGLITLRGAREMAPVVVAARTVVLAAGARERFLPFPGWTLPNVLGVGGVQALVKAGMSVAGKRVVLAGSGPLLLPVAATLAEHGASVRFVAEQAPARSVRRFAAGLWRTPGKLLQAARYRAAFRRAPYATGTWVVEAHGTGRVEWATLTDGSRTWVTSCDLLCVGYGLVPSIELAALAGCELAGDAVLVDDQQQTTIPGIYCAGEQAGVGGADLATTEGEIAGLAAAGVDPPPALRRARDRHRKFAERTRRAFEIRTELLRLAQADTIVCRCEDVRAGELEPTWSPRQAKLYTRAGMGPCQGRICGVALTSIYGWPHDTVRPPAVAIPVSSLLESPDPVPTG